MGLSVGVDMESLNRFREKCHDDGFLHLIYTPEEIAYCRKKIDPCPSLAARFCAKEAVIKAMDDSVTMKDIEIVKDEKGKLAVKVKGVLDKALHCSISHTEEYAVAFVVRGVLDG